MARLLSSGVSSSLDKTAAAAADDVVTLDVDGDTQLRFVLNADGSQEWGSGSAAADVTLSRSAANTLALGTGDSLQIADGNVVLSATTGTKFATATTQKLAFWNATPVARPAGIADPGAISAVFVQTEVAELRARIIDVISRLETLGLIATV